MNTSVYPPQIIEETNLGIQRFDIRNAMLASRELELSGPVDSESVAVIIRGILYLQKVDAAAPITLFINSPGGEVSSGLALYDVMQAASCPIRTVCLGLAASMAALLFIAGGTHRTAPRPTSAVCPVRVRIPCSGKARTCGSRWYESRSPP